jgi:hypothetical protein
LLLGHPAWANLGAEHNESIVTYSVAFFDMLVAGGRDDALKTAR